MLTVIGVTVETISANALDSWLQSWRLFPSMSRDLAAWPAPISGLLGYLCVTFLVYWWHRLRHASSLCWRIFHQVHHSPARIEVLTTFYAHPADFVSNAAIVAAVAFALLGLGPLAAGWCLFWVGLFEIWEHTNIRTPVWLGYIIVRPEMHRVHHEYGIHAKNYGLPIWDILFGTYENSTRQVDRCGFDEDRERRLLSMLAARDVHLFGRGK
jgi:sterol desaturase/sphingolipid hydroxylase (fatty acid hydroxylase superfamily)